MEAAITPSLPPSIKRASTKSKTAVTAMAGKPANRKAKTVVKEIPEMVDITAMIAEAAYLMAANRGFAPGHEVDDWLKAEQQILSRYR